ncbi:MAG: hypothetical protein FWH18_07495 [Marinilabiliaceae bacterium]|nr:hypothetical protein [Marinilabiliaceae bacterium]
MKKFESMSKITKLSLTFILLATIIITGCKSETERLNSLDDLNELSIGLKSGGALLSLSYEMTTYQIYYYDFDELTEIDLAHLNPSEEKQRVEVYIMPDGTINMAIEEMDFERKINIPHEIEPSDVPQTKRTEIIGNTVTFYDGSRRMLATENFQSEKMVEWAEQIKQSSNQDAAQKYANLQSNIWGQTIENTIEEARTRGMFVEYDDQIVSVRQNLCDIMHQATGAIVTIIDRNINKMVAYTIYDENEKITSTMFFGYETEGAHLMNATRTETVLEMPSGAEVLQITSTKIENYIFNLN